MRYLFQGQTLRGAYESFYDFNPATVEPYAHPDHPDLAMWLDKDFWSDRWQYNNAFAGLPDQTLETLFEITTMALATSEVSYLSEPAFPARSFRVSVESTTTETFTWTATIAPDGLPWLNMTPLGGSSGEQMTITLTPTGLDPGTHRASIRVLAGDPEIEDGDQTIAVTLQIVDQVHAVYFPLVRRQ